MSPVGGSRHYTGGTLGHEAGWACPSCGADNAGPIAQGCTVCGAGRPGRHIGTPPPPAPRVSERPPDDPTYQPDRPAPAAEGEEQLGVFDRWALAHPQATLEDAFTAGYLEGMREARRQPRADAPAPPVPAVEPIAYSPDHIINRTLVAALELFRDQVLSADPEETRTGEWLTQFQVSALIQQIKGEVVHG